MHSPATAWSRCAGMSLGTGGRLFGSAVQVTKARPINAILASEQRNQNITKEAGR